MTDTERLIAAEAIRTVKARYFRALDTKDWDLLGAVFAPDAHCDFRGADVDPVSGACAVPGATDTVLVGRDMIVASLSAGLGDVVSIHAGFMPEIEVIDAHSARGVWAMSDVLRFPAGPLAEMRGWGHYHERYAYADGQWRIDRLRLTRIALEIVRRD